MRTASPRFQHDKMSELEGTWQVHPSLCNADKTGSATQSSNQHTCSVTQTVSNLDAGPCLNKFPRRTRKSSGWLRPPSSLVAERAERLEAFVTTHADMRPRHQDRSIYEHRKDYMMQLY